MRAFPSFPNYTESMYNGDEPCGKKGHYDRWLCKWGEGESNHNDLVCAKFQLNQKITIYIVGKVLWIADIRHNGRPDCWIYSSHPDEVYSLACHPNYVHDLESEKIVKILNTHIESNFWRMVQRRAKEIYRLDGGDV